MVYLVLVLFLLIGGVVTMIAVENLSTSVHLTIFGWETPELPLGAWLIACFLLGALVLYLVAVLSALGERRELKRLRRRMAELEPLTARSLLQTRTTLPLSTSGPLAANSNGLLPMPGIQAAPYTSDGPTLPPPEARQ